MTNPLSDLTVSFRDVVKACLMVMNQAKNTCTDHDADERGHACVDVAGVLAAYKIKDTINGSDVQGIFEEELTAWKERHKNGDYSQDVDFTSDGMPNGWPYLTGNTDNLFQGFPTEKTELENLKSQATFPVDLSSIPRELADWAVSGQKLGLVNIDISIADEGLAIAAGSPKNPVTEKFIKDWKEKEAMGPRIEAVFDGLDSDDRRTLALCARGHKAMDMKRPTGLYRIKFGVKLEKDSRLTWIVTCEAPTLLATHPLSKRIGTQIKDAVLPLVIDGFLTWAKSPDMVWLDPNYQKTEAEG